jgi:hypothetical protein
MNANILVLGLVGFAALVLVHPRVRRSTDWRATVTPLASIIGSGFLVLAPLLVREFGTRAIWVMAGLCGVAYFVGEAIRFNISRRDVAPERTHMLSATLEAASSWTLAVAYVISVCYYLNLFGAFALRMVLPDSPTAGKLLTSLVLVAIALIGWTRGLRGLERAESVTVAIKLAVIAGLLGGMAHFTWDLAGRGALQTGGGRFNWDSLRLAFGLIITVQGFETSRYLHEAYSANTRIRTMRRAQWLSTAIYLTYVGFAGLDFAASSLPLQETAIIGMMQPIATTLPILLVVAALAAQFSAAVADTNGCGGLTQEMSGGRFSSRMAYVALAALALCLTWAADIYQIISYASRGFAVYYSLQCALATRLSRDEGGSPWRTAGFVLLTVLLAAAALLGIPAA